MAALAPFERHPIIAVGVSGGADSMALVLSAERWAREQGGRAVGLIVDHGLRSVSAAEAGQASAWLDAAGIENHVLVWRPDRIPHSAVQAQARNARFTLLQAWCRERGVLHLLLAHHRRDQAETVEMRRQRDPTAFGVSGMSMIVENADVRILRPLLDTDPADLRDRLRAARQEWIEDPSNCDRRFERVRVREWLPADVEPIVDMGREAARRRTRSEAQRIALLAETACMAPAGHAWLWPEPLRAAGLESAAWVFGHVIRTVSGGDYPAKREKCQRLAERLLFDSGRGATLGGCRIESRRVHSRDRILVCREAAALAPQVVIVPGKTVVWDGRFRITAPTNLPAGRYTVGGLGTDGWRDIASSCCASADPGLPASARSVVPAIRRDEVAVWVPYLTLLAPERHSYTWQGFLMRPNVPESLKNSRFFIAPTRK